MTNPQNQLSWLVRNPIAHRGLHDESVRRYENSRSAVLAAIESGYSVEVDLQVSSDGVPIVFHDYEIERMTSGFGQVSKKTANELEASNLRDSYDTIWRFTDFLELVKGRVPVVVELKGNKDDGQSFISAVLSALSKYDGEHALMSFDHSLVEEIAAKSPETVLGLTAEGGDDRYHVHKSFLNQTAVDFVSYDHEDLPCRIVEETRLEAMPVICWTIKDQKAADKAMLYSDQITFEGFVPTDRCTGDQAQT